MCVLKGENEVNCCERSEGDCDIVWQIVILFGKL